MVNLLLEKPIMICSTLIYIQSSMNRTYLNYTNRISIVLRELLSQKLSIVLVG